MSIPIVLQSEVGGPTTQTITVTTDPNTFEVEHIFDLGKPCTAHIKMTIVAFDPDGETPGDETGETPGVDPGDIGVYTDRPVISQDGIDYFSASGVFVPLHNDVPFLVGGINDHLTSTGRFAKTRSFIYDAGTFAKYAGAHHPVAQVRLDVTF